MPILQPTISPIGTVVAAYAWCSRKVPRSSRRARRYQASGGTVNVEAALTETPALPHFEHVHIGRVPVPGWLADWVLARALARFERHEHYDFAGDVIKQVNFTEGQLAVIYAWQADLSDKLRAVVLPRDDQERLRVYHEKLSEVARSLAAKRISLTDVLPALFKLAQERSRSGDPMVENRAAILVLTFYANRTGLAAIVPAARNWPRPVARTLTLHGRGDFPKHFLISAALAANAGGPLSDAVGLYKEVETTRVTAVASRSMTLRRIGLARRLVSSPPAAKDGGAAATAPQCWRP